MTSKKRTKNYRHENAAPSTKRMKVEHTISKFSPNSVDTGNKRTHKEIQKQIQQQHSETAVVFAAEKERTEPTRVKQFNQQKNKVLSVKTKLGKKKLTDPTRIKQFNKQKNNVLSVKTKLGKKKLTDPTRVKQFNQQKNKVLLVETKLGKKERTDPTRVKQFNQQKNKVLSVKTNLGKKERTDPTRVKQFNQKKNKVLSVKTKLGKKERTDPTRIKQFNEQEKNVLSVKTKLGKKERTDPTRVKLFNQQENKDHSVKTKLGKKERTDPTRVKLFNQQENKVQSVKTKLGKKERTDPTRIKQFNEQENNVHSVKIKLEQNERTDPTRVKQFNQQEYNAQVSWKELKKRKKSLKQMRKQKKFAVFNIIFQTKKLYEICKKNKFPKKERGEIVSKLYNLLKGHLKEIVYKHDMTRITQLLMKVSPESTRYAVWSELKPELLKMMVSKYAAHTVISMLEFGGKSVQKEVAGLLKGHLLELLKNKVASRVIDKIYKTYSLPEDRAWMRKELSGFRDDKTVSKLLETIERQGCFPPDSPESKLLQSLVECATQEEESSVTVSTKVTLQMLIEKGLAMNALVQSVLSDYLMKCNSTDREEFMSTLQPTLESILNAGLDSFYAVMLLVEYVWFGSSKEKKWITKQLHSKMPWICQQNYSYLLIMVVLECVDDTVLLKKTLLKDMISNVRDIIDDNYGRKIIMHILTPRNPRHFSSSYVSLLKLGDSTAVRKKSYEVRHAEILEHIINPLLGDITNDPSYWVSNGRRAILCYEAICAGKGTQLENVLKSIAFFVCQEKPGVLIDKGSEFSSQLEWLTKQLIKSDKQRLNENEITFSTFFLSTLTEEDIKSWVQGRAGAFLFVLLIETEIPSIQKTIKKLFTPDIKAIIDSSSTGQMLRNKLNQI